MQNAGMIIENDIFYVRLHLPRRTLDVLRKCPMRFMICVVIADGPLQPVCILIPQYLSS